MSIESENGGVKKPIMPVKIGKPATVNVKDSNIENESSNEEKDKNEDNSFVTGMILLKVMNLLMKQMKIIIQTK